MTKPDLTARILVLMFCLWSGVIAAAQTPIEPADEYGRWIHGLQTEAWFFNSDEYTPEQAAEARSLWKKVEGARGETKDEWAGDYFIGGDTSLSVVRWAPKVGFVRLDVSTCMANVNRLDLGEVVSATQDEIKIVSSRGASAAAERTLVKVKWGERRYLIEEHEVSRFCDYVAGLGEYNRPQGVLDYASFFLRDDDGGKPTAELPTVPERFKEYVRKPLDARITKIGRAYIEIDPENDSWDELITPVTINIGSDHKLRRDMSLPIIDEQADYGEKVIVTRVGRTSAQGIVVREIEKGHGDDPGAARFVEHQNYQPINVSWRLSTSEHKNMQRLDREMERARQEAPQ